MMHYDISLFIIVFFPFTHFFNDCLVSFDILVLVLGSLAQPSGKLLFSVLSLFLILSFAGGIFES